jgi:hypothetical protein
MKSLLELSSIKDHTKATACLAKNGLAFVAGDPVSDASNRLLSGDVIERQFNAESTSMNIAIVHK